MRSVNGGSRPALAAKLGRGLWSRFALLDAFSGAFRSRLLKPIIDPRLGDIENDASSTKSRSLLSLAGTLLTEISLPKLAVTWVLLILLPGLLLGMTPVVVSIWLSAFFDKVEAFQAGLWSAAVLALLLAVAMFSSRRLFRLAESNFWALNALAVQPIYAACREAMRQLFDGVSRPTAPILRNCAPPPLWSRASRSARSRCGCLPRRGPRRSSSAISAFCMIRGGWRGRRWPIAPCW